MIKAKNLMNTGLDVGVYPADPVILFHFPNAEYWGTYQEEGKTKKTFFLETSIEASDHIEDFMLNISPDERYRHFIVPGEFALFYQVFTSSYEVLEDSFDKESFLASVAKDLNRMYAARFNPVSPPGTTKCEYIESLENALRIRIDVLHYAFDSPCYGPASFSYDFWDMEKKSGTGGGCSYKELIRKLDKRLKKKGLEQIQLF